MCIIVGILKNYIKVSKNRSMVNVSCVFIREHSIWVKRMLMLVPN